VIDRLVGRSLSPLLRFRPVRLALLGWLSLRLRPFSLASIVATAIDRRFRGR
jgi:hypothetical protein